MKKIIVFLLITATLISCSKVGENEFIVNGKIAGVPDGKIVTLERFDDTRGAMTVDTVKLKDGKFSFKGKILEPEMHSIRVETVPSSSFIIIENNEIDIEINKDSILKNKVTGSYNNEQLCVFNKKSLDNEKKKKDFNTKYQAKFLAAQQNKDTASMKKIGLAYESLEKEFSTGVEEYISSNPKSLISSLLIKSLFNKFDLDVKKIERLYNGLDKSIQKNKVGVSILKKLNELKTVGVGKKAPNFSAKNPDGKVVSLNESLGKITIIDFWASWCGPCRKENPNMVKLYSEFHDKGLNIISVSLDKEAAKWEEAIATDKLSWTHISNLQEFKDPIAIQYGVNQIPTTFVLNQFGIVMAKDLTGDALRTKINELLTAVK